MDPQEALRQRGSVAQPDRSPQDVQEGDGITSLLRCSGGELRAPGGVIHRRIPAVSSFSIMHAIRKEAPSLKVKACFSKIERTTNQIARSSWRKNPTYPPRWQHPATTSNVPQRFFTVTNATYRSDSQSKSPLILLMSSLLFFPSYDREEERKHGGPSKEKTATEPGPLVDVEEP